VGVRLAMTFLLPFCSVSAGWDSLGAGKFLWGPNYSSKPLEISFFCEISSGYFYFNF
jgi:hypothetical protein